MNGTADRGSQGSRRDIEENRPSSGSVKIPLLQKESSTRSLLGGMGFADEFVETMARFRLRDWLPSSTSLINPK
jgi:hypothetical protein